MGRHAASATLFLSGSLHYLDEGPDGVAVDGRFGFWHAPGGQWRIEDEDGHLVYLRGADGTAFVRGSDGELEQLNARIVVPTLASFSPLEAIAPHSVVNNLSEGMRPLGPVARGEVGSRSAWTIPLGSETPVIVVSFDHATGVLVRLMNAEGLVPFQVTKLLQHDSLPLDRFQLL